MYSPEDGVGLSLCRVLDVGIVQQLLDAHQDLLDRDGGAPVLLVIEEGEAHLVGGRAVFIISDYISYWDLT